MPAYKPCHEPLRIEPVTFYIKGPFIRGGLLMAHVFLLTCASLALAALTASGRGGIGDVLAGWWWRVPLWIGPPIFHFWFLKTYVEGRTPHYLEDRFRSWLRLRLCFLRPWPDRIPLFPRLVPEAEETVKVLRAPRRPGGRKPRIYNTQPTYNAHPTLRLDS